ncbi:Ubiquitin conjugating enzyme Ubc6 [Schizosaccharomyces pombe]|uniref:Ubiquitin-conjugating enzyme E2 6 n=1 Tax=Schizosaccharomyces pombe (strain 972 / ATCC 24843) TaxID=284812 RepID=UBC6_SCHPO|nr:putative ubiquitin conjugating enzyme Ubc6 [Schizosaccharomyces pombe]O42646.1 RecName: Full=Ubiquitin-conjugating enzyme E2 6; AltName: Full=E2 ubiquitin-conjugating enzyme 6; AltName: Full=Ubiquitin carrier protein 6; AltName: Full=Ubiquitin-protein ligase 6 [Schizosaccharomyces pombe 972h-]CAA15718.1 ubiquitin conjugating enzyme Ubc6 (predicted) [Schizosaccharomyces pombe]|eukprot:NP_593256.1 putative ubiquitin conjugating enzyme Ubc6 [Schizosaccharomyces pombe]
MASKGAYKRLMKEYLALQKNPVELVDAKPATENILEWHYIITGPPDTPYEGGQYHGTLIFPPDYPFKPPAIRMITPSGRFQTNTRLCLSFSDFHPKSWNPSWMVSTILVGLVSFMTSDEITTGGIVTSESTRRTYAKDTKRFNIMDNPKFLIMFPELIDKNREDIAKAAAEAALIEPQQIHSTPVSSNECKKNEPFNSKQSWVKSRWSIAVLVFFALALARFFGADS